MQKKLILLLGLSALLFYGCFYRETEMLDPIVEEKSVTGPLPSIRLGVFRNYSGVSLPLLVRGAGNRVAMPHEYNWIMGPEALMEREFRRVFPVVSRRERTVPKLTLSIYRFELDSVKKCARIEVGIEIEKTGAKTENFRRYFTSPVKNTGAAAINRAFSDCIRQAVEFCASQLGLKLPADKKTNQK